MQRHFFGYSVHVHNVSSLFHTNMSQLDTFEDVTSDFRVFSQTSPARTNRRATADRYSQFVDKEAILSVITNSTVHVETVREMMQVVQSSNNKFYGGIGVKNIVYLFVYWLLTGDSYRDIAALSGYPKSNYKQAFGAVRVTLQKWSKSQIFTSMLQEEMTAEEVRGYMVLQAELRQADSLTTIRDPALQRTTLIMDKTLKLSEDDIRDTKYVSGVDWIIADSGYQGIKKLFARSESIAKRPKKGNLNQYQLSRNTQLSSVRSTVERVFG